ncbi:MAG: sporulation protein YunB [Deltaproteobacteria bacterium]
MLSHKFKLAGIAMLILLIIVSLIVFDIRIKASVLAIAQAKVQASETEAINQIINREVVGKTSYEDLVRIHKDESGRIVLLQPDTIVINRIMADTTESITKNMGQMDEQTVSIPLGQITGVTLLAGYGPKIRVKVLPCGQVHVDIINKFDEAGVNQTRHLIYCRISTKMKIAVPLMDEEIKVSTIVPLAETIIIGDVPRTYVNYKDKQDMPYSVINGEQDTD